MKLIVGLGNPGSKYAGTRHNLGFMVLDHIAEHLGIKFGVETRFEAEVSLTEVKGERLVLAKPQTMMNLSGRAAQRLAQYYKITATDIWVVQDDIDLNFGILRVRQGGGSGGHNGIKSIIEQLGGDFVRFRVGVANSTLRTRIDPEEFVLQPFEKSELALLPALVRGTAEQIAAHLGDKEILDHTHDLTAK